MALYNLPGTQFPLYENDTLEKLGLYKIAWNGSQAPQILEGKTLIVKIEYLGIDYYRLVDNQETIDDIYIYHNAGIISHGGPQFWAPNPFIERRVKNQLITPEIRKIQRQKE